MGNCILTKSTGNTIIWGNPADCLNIPRTELGTTEWTAPEPCMLYVVRHWNDPGTITINGNLITDYYAGAMYQSFIWFMNTGDTIRTNGNGWRYYQAWRLKKYTV